MAEDKWDLGEFSGDEDAQGGFSIIDSGKYEAYVFEVSREVGKDSGKPYLKWTFKIADGQPFEGRMLWENTSLAENARWKLVQILKGIGIDVPKGKLVLSPAAIMGKKCTIQVGKELDKYANDRDGTTDQYRNVIKSYMPAGTVNKPKIDVPAPKAAAAKTAAKTTPKKAEPAEDDFAEEQPAQSEPVENVKLEEVTPEAVVDCSDGNDGADDFDFA